MIFQACKIEKLIVNGFFEIFSSRWNSVPELTYWENQPFHFPNWVIVVPEKALLEIHELYWIIWSNRTVSIGRTHFVVGSLAWSTLLFAMFEIHLFHKMKLFSPSILTQTSTKIHFSLGRTEVAAWLSALLDGKSSTTSCILWKKLFCVTF